MQAHGFKFYRSRKVREYFGIRIRFKARAYWQDE